MLWLCRPAGDEETALDVAALAIGPFLAVYALWGLVDDEVYALFAANIAVSGLGGTDEWSVNLQWLRVLRRPGVVAWVLRQLVGLAEPAPTSTVRCCCSGSSWRGSGRSPPRLALLAGFGRVVDWVTLPGGLAGAGPTAGTPSSTLLPDLRLPFDLTLPEAVARSWLDGSTRHPAARRLVGGPAAAGLARADGRGVRLARARCPDGGRRHRLGPRSRTIGPVTRLDVRVAGDPCCDRVGLLRHRGPAHQVPAGAARLPAAVGRPDPRSWRPTWCVATVVETARGLGDPRPGPAARAARPVRRPGLVLGRGAAGRLRLHHGRGRAVRRRRSPGARPSGRQPRPQLQQRRDRCPPTDRTRTVTSSTTSAGTWNTVPDLERHPDPRRASPAHPVQLTASGLATS